VTAGATPSGHGEASPDAAQPSIPVVPPSERVDAHDVGHGEVNEPVVDY